MRDGAPLPAIAASGAAPVGACPSCGRVAGPPFFVADDLPVFCNVPAASHEEALHVPRASIRLVRCAGCGLVHNVDFDPARLEYGTGYENALHHSAVFREYARSIAASLVERYGLAGGAALEIGCGQGDFLRLLHGCGMARGIGFDPGFDPERAGALPEAISIAAALFTGRELDEPVDLVCCRHVLEHLIRPLEMLGALRRGPAGAPDTLLLFEVPNALWTFRALGVWDIIYEHCCYYDPSSIARLFERAGFEPLAVTETYGGQFLTIEARPARGVRPEPREAPVDDLADAFGRAWRRRVDAWREALDEIAARDERIVLWGAGSKGVTFLNALGLGIDRIPLVVDLNPHKQGRHVAGTGQPIIGPDDLPAHRPDHVVVMNPLYVDEIRRDLADRGITATLHAA